MKRQIILRPKAVHYVSDPKRVDPGTSPYPWANTPSLTLAEAWADDLNSSYFYPITTHEGLVTLDPAPTLALFTKVTLAVQWDYSQFGANQWYFPPDNTYAPGINLIVIGRDGTTHNVSAWHTVEEGGSPNNVNRNTHPTTYALYEQTWEMTAHPEGGPWTFDDVNNLIVGAGCRMSNGPSGQPWDPSGVGFFKLRVVSLAVTVDFIDLGGFVENVRRFSALIARLYRRPRGAITPQTFLDRAPSLLGQRVYFSHPRGPSVSATPAESLGWGRRRLERRGGLILRRTHFPGTFKVQDEALDLRPFACLGWAAYRIDGAWSPELQGMSLVDKGAGFTHSRAQDGWSPRPGDGVLMRVLEDYPNLSEEGLAAQAGADESVCLYNFDLMQTGWSTVGDAGDFTATQDETVTMVEEQGYFSSAELVYGSGGGTGGRARSLGTLPYNAGDFLHIWASLKNTSVPTPATQNAELYLMRDGGGLAAAEYWDETNRIWTTTPTYNAFPSDGPYGRLIIDAIPLDAAGASSDPTYTIAVGRFSSSLTDVTFHAALVDAQHTDSTVAGARSPIVTLGSPITREPDLHTLANSSAVELWSYERGVVVAEAWPFWRAEDLPADAVKPLIHAQHDTDTYDALQFVPKTGSDDLVRFERAVSGESTFQLDCPIDGIDLTRAHVLRAWARWLGADGWDRYAPYSVEVGYAVFLKATGALVGSGSILGALAYTGAVSARDFLGIGTDGATLHFDGRIRMWETRRNPLHGVECIWKV